MKDETTMELEKHVIELTRRVMALEAWKAEMLNHAISVTMTPPSKVERGQYGGDDLPPGVSVFPAKASDVLASQPLLDETKWADVANQHYSQPIGYDQRPLDRQPEIDWEKVAAAMHDRPGFKGPRWRELADYQKGTSISDARAAVAEYLRQVEQRHQDNFTEVMSQFIFSENPLVIDREKIRKALQVSDDSSYKEAARCVLSRFQKEENEKRQVKEGGK